MPHHIVPNTKSVGKADILPASVDRTIIVPPTSPDAIKHDDLANRSLPENHPHYIKRGESLPVMEGPRGRAGADGFGVPGAPGPAGAAGAAGPQGAPGPMGIIGMDGPRGPQGDTIPGPQGPAGTPGTPGAPGTPGTTGSRGSDGLPGIDGSRGRDGEWGPPGPRGIRGDKGDLGPMGLDGHRGSDGMGIPGPKGDTGPQGPQGAPGGGASVKYGLVDVDFGSSQVYQKTWRVFDGAISDGMEVTAFLARTQPSGEDDEAEVEPMIVQCAKVVAGAFSLTAAPIDGPVVGQYRFAYLALSANATKNGISEGGLSLAAITRSLGLETTTPYTVGQTGSGSATFPKAGEVVVQAFTTAGTASVKNDSSGGAMINWSKHPRFQGRAFYGNASLDANSRVRFGMGDLTGALTSKHIGFRFDGTNVLATVGDGIAESTAIVQTGNPSTGGPTYNYSCEIVAGVAKFYVDGALLASISTNVPSGNDSSAVYFSCYADNNGGVGTSFLRMGMVTVSEDE